MSETNEGYVVVLRDRVCSCHIPASDLMAARREQLIRHDGMTYASWIELRNPHERRADVVRHTVIGSAVTPRGVVLTEGR